MGKILIILAALTLFASAFLTSCDTGGCTDLRSSVPRADFYSSATEKQIVIDSLQITGVGAPGDSVLYGPGSRLSSVYLPMPAQTNTVKWRIAYMQSDLAGYDVADTISLDFERQPWFAGEECGAMYKYRITRLEYTNYLIDSVALADSLVINVDRATLNIYFRTE